MADFLSTRLDKIQSAGNFRSLAGTLVGVDFWSNDYLGLARTPNQVRDAGAPALERRSAERQGKLDEAGERPAYSGATGSRSISGDADAYHAIEQMIADYHGYPTATVFNSGYTANLGLLSCLLKRGDVILYDELMHASCRDGIRLGLAGAVKFPHNDLEETLLRIAAKERVTGQLFVLTEARFSMDGDLAPLSAIAALCQQYGAHLLVDEAHSTGLEGPQGRGLVAALGLQQQVFATIVTYGKALGGHGAAVLGSPALRDYLINTCRPFVYTTGPAPEQWRSIAAGYAKLESLHAERYAHLQQIITLFRSAMSVAGLASYLLPGDGPIQIVLLPGNEAVMAAETACRNAGLLVKGIRSPTVAAGRERLRICLHSFNTPAEINRLTGCLAAII
jgi:8-amino-7-oxononanoate synthase